MIYKYLLAASLLCVSACGFSPLYATQSNEKTTDLTAQIHITPIANYTGFKLQTQLADQLNPSKLSVPEKYDLVVTLDKPIISEQNIMENNFSSRQRVILVAHYKLIDRATKKVLIDTQTSATGAYNIAIEPYATYTASQKVEIDLLKILSQTISVHLISYMRKNEAPREG